METCFFVYDLIFYTGKQIKFFYIEKSNNQIVLFKVIKYRKIRWTKLETVWMYVTRSIYENQFYVPLESNYKVWYIGETPYSS